jgi:hypothetical protein
MTASYGSSGRPGHDARPGRRRPPQRRSWRRRAPAGAPRAGAGSGHTGSRGGSRAPPSGLRRRVGGRRHTEPARSRRRSPASDPAGCPGARDRVRHPKGFPLRRPANRSDRDRRRHTFCTSSARRRLPRREAGWCGGARGRLRVVTRTVQRVPCIIFVASTRGASAIERYRVYGPAGGRVTFLAAGGDVLRIEQRAADQPRALDTAASRRSSTASGSGRIAQSGPERRWVLGGGAVPWRPRVHGGRSGDEPAPPPPPGVRALADRMLTAARYANLTARPRSCVARDAVGAHPARRTAPARSSGRAAARGPGIGVDPREPKPGFRHSSPYPCGAGNTLGLANREGRGRPP